MKKNLFFLPCIILVFISMLFAGCQKKTPLTETDQSMSRTTAYVQRVIDGDTLVVQLQQHSYHLRFIGVDTPETKRPHTPVMFYGPQASAYTKRILRHQTVSLEWDVQREDKYGRLLAYVWIGKELFNRTLVRKGYARVETIPPDVKYESVFKTAQNRAKSEKLGVWKNYKAAFDY